ncbi:MAG: DNA gyrase subunit A, partial [Mariprofundaceae bacterium]|nr:DNA gyrase subunit A [Mariprofundaceae bacterium]
MVENYSGEYKEPLVFHPPVPFWLLNGGSGIAVAVYYGVPPHNARQVFRLVEEYINKKGQLSVEEAVEILGGPDYIQGGVLVSSKEDLINLYKTGKGSLEFRCSYHYEEIDNKHVLVITGAAPGIKLNKLLQKLQDLVDQNILEYVNDVSGKDIRILVGFTSKRLLEKRVLPLLRSRINYNFALTIKQNDGSALFREVSLL